MFKLRSLTDEELLFLSHVVTVIQQSKCFPSPLALKEEISAEREKRLQQRDGQHPHMTLKAPRIQACKRW
jgi:hypothetical protein